MIIDPSLERPELQAINNISVHSHLPVTVHCPALFGTSSMNNRLIRGCAGLIILGSLASIHDHNSWQNEIIDLIRAAANKNIPALGLCYGHQLLAHIYGGKVEKLWNGELKSGIRKVTLSRNTLWGDETTENMAYSHIEGVTVCPPGFDIVARSDMVEIEGIWAQDRPIWGFQPHLEATTDFFKRKNINNKNLNSFGPHIMKLFLNYCTNYHNLIKN